ncbi:hypothetical protein LTR36_001348 [Oleoguttula mirabilis]|uniref:Uncharacterized protein n=1 Tax=Oleoguttula mirabilis TaxID=1507867 RepID=A0AAV9JQ46_9PEZI|nr:hypothetical protein LTR36_001348 [Oleoguttula mirabilis]
MATADDVRAIRETLSQMQSSQTEILERLGHLEHAQSEAAGHHNSLVTHTGHMIRQLNDRVAGLDLQGYKLARDRALAVTEILESILVELPMRDLLFAQRVDKRFQSVIQSSQKLQRALFFLPEPVGTEPHINPLLSHSKSLDKFPPFYYANFLDGSPPHVITALDRNIAQVRLRQEIDHRLLCMMLRQDTVGSYKLFLWFCPVKESSSLNQPMTQKMECSSDVAGVASWRRMVLCQPPPSVVFVAWPRYRNEPRSKNKVYSKDGSGTLLSFFKEVVGNE